MAELKVGTVTTWHLLSPILATFRLAPETGTPFPVYKSGQYIALRREDCQLTRRSIGPDGRPQIVPILDEEGKPKRGPVTHSYSIASAPFETARDGFLEFYVVLEADEEGHPGRLTESLFKINPPADERLTYVNRIVGDFTLDRRTEGLASVVFVGTGTGLAPFLSMAKQLDFEAQGGRPDPRQYTLFHTNRTSEELGYHQELLQIQAARRFDFLYVPSVSRPTPANLQDASLGKGRANNLLRHALGYPLKEEEEGTPLDRVVRPALPGHVDPEGLRRRLGAETSVILTCGNASLMGDVKAVADRAGIRFEKEDW